MPGSPSLWPWVGTAVCARSTTATKTKNAVTLTRPLWCHKRRERGRIVGRSLYRIPNRHATNQAHGVQRRTRESAPRCKEARIARLTYRQNPGSRYGGLKVAFQSDRKSVV